MKSGLAEVAHVFGSQVDRHLTCDGGGVVYEHEFLNLFMPLFVTFGTHEAKNSQIVCKIFFPGCDHGQQIKVGLG
jgi:hypothetical protein